MKKRRIYLLSATVSILIAALALIIYIILKKFNLINSLFSEILIIFFAVILIIDFIIFLTINNLTKLSTEISLGDYEKRVNLISNNKINKLGEAFNRMADRLQNTIIDLDDKKNKMYSILNSIDDGVIVVDNDLRILIINPSAKKMFNVSEDSDGRYFIEVIRNYDIEEIIKSMAEDEYEINLSYPEYKKLKIRTKRVIQSNSKNKDIGLLVFIQDITKINQLEKMRSEFVANVSHELKSPLTSIKGFIETLKYVDDKATKDKFLDIIYEESERLTRLISDILTLSELENKDTAINFEKVDVDKSLNDIVYIMMPIAKNKNIHINYKNMCSDKDIFINGSRDKFKQMIINLIDNGIKYTNEGGNIDVTLGIDKSNAEIKIKDNGIGIPKEHIPRLFERFYRVDKARSRKQGGTGLGLAIVKHILVLFNGDINVESEVGVGTTFIIHLPVL